MLQASNVEIIATVCFVLAILHTFSVSVLRSWAARFPKGSIPKNLLHLLGEVEVVFGLWAGIYVAVLSLIQGTDTSIAYLEKLNFTEPVFVFVVMSVASTRPILEWAGFLITALARAVPLPKSVSFYLVTLILGSLVGSFITEPAAMTVTAMILLERYFNKKLSLAFKYFTLGTLFVCVSIGGTLTPFAAPPVLMVAGIWGWDMPHMLLNFGYKSAVAVVATSALATAVFFKELKALGIPPKHKAFSAPLWVGLVNILFLVGIVTVHSKLVVFAGLFLFFLGFVSVTREHQEDLKLKESLLVAFFLGGLVVLGGPQRWWLEPLLVQLDAGTLFLGSIGLTALVDNAALTYLGAQVPGLTELSKYSLVAGAVVGGGLTVIANAPNPAGYSILNSSFGAGGISAAKLFAGALIPTVIAACALWFLP